MLHPLRLFNPFLKSLHRLRLPLHHHKHTVKVSETRLSQFVQVVFRAGHSWCRHFAKQVRVQGRFTATGGARNDVEVYVLGKNEFTNWSNGNPTNTFYNSGRATVGDLSVALPDGFGQYYLVFNNKFSLLTPKAVEFDGTMTYYQ